jgi:hypothetical protein
VCLPGHRDAGAVQAVLHKAPGQERTRIRSALYGAQARAAFRSVQPFRIHEEALHLGVQVTDTYEQEYRWSEPYRLTQLSNLDTHRRLTLMAWWPDLVYWTSNGSSNRRWLGGDGTFTDGSVLWVHGRPRCRHRRRGVPRLQLGPRRRPGARRQRSDQQSPGMMSSDGSPT